MQTLWIALEVFLNTHVKQTVGKLALKILFYIELTYCFPPLLLMTVLRARWAGKIIPFQTNIEDEGAGKATDPTSLLFAVVLRITTIYCFTVST